MARKTAPAAFRPVRFTFANGCDCSATALATQEAAADAYAKGHYATAANLYDISARLWDACGSAANAENMRTGAKRARQDMERRQDSMLIGAGA